MQHAPSSATYRSLEVGGDRTHEPDQFELAYPGGPGKVAPETVQLALRVLPPVLPDCRYLLT